MTVDPDSSARALERLPIEVDGQALSRQATPLVLVIDDECATRRCLQNALREQGFRVIEATTGAQGLALAAGHNPDLVILGDRSPEVDSIDVTQKLRAWTEMPVVILSARDDEGGKVAALDAGANDYLTKPFGTGELLARIRVWLRHTQCPGPCAPDSILEVGNLRVDPAKRLASIGGVEVHFTPIEYKLLTLFLRNVGKVLTHEHLLVAVWGKAYGRETQYLRVFVGQLRQKIEEDPARPRYIVTEPGVGYRLRADE
jgi:two-component system, OmpR family, KDP operon response regulator KdpE